VELKPGHKQTEVGVIPGEWEVKELSALLEPSRGIRYGIVQPGKHNPRGCLMLRSQDYSKGWANPGDMHRVNSLLENQYRNARIRSSDLIMTIVGAGIGQVEVAPSWLDGAILSRSTARIAIDEKQAARGFINACLQSPLGKRQILNCQKEGAQPVVSCRDLAKFLVPYPSPPEQRAIAGALSDVDELIGRLDQLTVKKRDLKQATMQQLLTGKKRLPGFHGEWEVKRLGGLAKIQRGASPRPIDSPIWFDENSSIGWVRISDVTSSGMYLRETTQQLSSLGVQSSRPVGRGSLIMSICGTVGRPIITEIDACIHDGFVVFDNLKLAKHYLYYVLKAIEGDWSRHGQTGSQMNLNTGLINRTEIRIPPTSDEQTAIAEVLSDMDAEIATLEQRRDKTRDLKQGMMQELLTGRTRLV
jgi:type I restriction enzyme, S subunit